MICFYATEVASPKTGASTLVVDRYDKRVLYATEVTSPLFGAAVLTADGCSEMMFYANEFASPCGTSTSVVDDMYATAPKGIHSDKVASPGCL